MNQNKLLWFPEFDNSLIRFSFFFVCNSHSFDSYIILIVIYIEI